MPVQAYAWLAKIIVQYVALQVEFAFNVKYNSFFYQVFATNLILPHPTQM